VGFISYTCICSDFILGKKSIAGSERAVQAQISDGRAYDKKTSNPYSPLHADSSSGAVTDTHKED
jgi:hypothetical protein